MSSIPTAVTEKANDAVVTLQGDASLVGGSQADVDWSIGTPAAGWVVGEVKI